MSRAWKFIPSDGTMLFADKQITATGVVNFQADLEKDPEGKITKLSAAPKIWDGLVHFGGPLVCACDITGTTKGEMTEADSLNVDAFKSVEAEVQALAYSRCDQNAIKYNYPGGSYRDKMLAAIKAKGDFLGSTITAQELEDILNVARALPYTQCRNAVLDACRADVGGAAWGTCWITAFLKDRVTVEPQFEATVTAALGI